MRQNPLTDHTRREIDAALRKLADAGELIGRCERCGLTMAEQESDRQALIQTLENIRNEFFGPINPKQV